MNESPSFRIGGEEREFLLVQAISRERPQSLDFWDGNWLDARVHVSAGAFAGGYRASLRSDEFAHFLSGLRLIYTSLGTEIPSYVAEFAAMEDQLSIVVRGDGLGNFVAHCIAIDELGTGNRLEFDLAFDQTYIPAILTGLESVLEAFPVLGSPSA